MSSPNSHIILDSNQYLFACEIEQDVGKIHVHWRLVPFSTTDRAEFHLKQLNLVYNQHEQEQIVESMKHPSTKFLKISISERWKWKKKRSNTGSSFRNQRHILIYCDSCITIDMFVFIEILLNKCY